MGIKGKGLKTKDCFLLKFVKLFYDTAKFRLLPVNG